MVQDKHNRMNAIIIDTALLCRYMATCADCDEFTAAQFIFRESEYISLVQSQTPLDEELDIPEVDLIGYVCFCTRMDSETARRLFDAETSYYTQCGVDGSYLIVQRYTTSDGVLYRALMLREPNRSLQTSGE